MSWTIGNKTTQQPITERRFDTYGEAVSFLVRMQEAGRSFSPLYVGTDTTYRRMINEGLVQGDLEGILLPIISFDVYLPTDAESDNIVVGFIIKGVPEAVLPFVNFCEYCNGVVSVDYSDSDLIHNASVVYMEFLRTRFRMEQLETIMDQIKLLSGLSVDDFNLMLPDSTNKVPFTFDAVQEYLSRTSTKKNLALQQQAYDRAQAEHELDQFGNQPDTDDEDTDVTESFVRYLANLPLER